MARNVYTAGAHTEPSGVAELGDALVLTTARRVRQLGLQAPVAGGLEQLGAGHGDVADPDQRDGDPADGVVGDQDDAAGQHEEERAAALGAQRVGDADDARGRRRPAAATAITVLVPNSQASSTRGASVSSTSQSGMTTLSSTWWVARTPPQTDISRKARLRSALAPPVGLDRVLQRRLGAPTWCAGPGESRRRGPR